MEKKYSKLTIEHNIHVINNYLKQHGYAVTRESNYTFILRKSINNDLLFNRYFYSKQEVIDFCNNIG
jgi:hypothetical protein